MSQYFVTGTDTGVGKTYVTCELARLAVSTGRRVFAFKPIETGVTESEGEDQVALCSAAGDWQRGPQRGLYRFRMPAAPRVAATTAIDLELIVRTTLDQVADVVLVEGAGGWRVPITDTTDMGGLAKRLGFPVILVARATLGTINHTLLSIEAIQRDGCELAAVVLSVRPEDDQAFAASNATEVRRLFRGRVLEHSRQQSGLATLLGAGGLHVERS